MNIEKKPLSEAESSKTKIDDFTIFSSYKILEDGTKVFSAED